jgi:hypothetical protein
VDRRLPVKGRRRRQSGAFTNARELGKFLTFCGELAGIARAPPGQNGQNNAEQNGDQ